MDLSIVTTVYYSADHLEEFYARTCAVAEKITPNFEIIFVNDGSTDNSLEIVLSIYRRDQRVRVIDLSRNFGHHKAIMTGLGYTRGKLVFLLDCDLEEDPELLETFYQHLNATEADVIFGVQEKRKGKFFERVTGALFFKLMNAVSSHRMPANVITARLMTRQYVSELIRHREREMVIMGLWALTGFTQVPLVVRKHSRTPTTYNLGRKISHAVNAITSFSNKPLIFIFYLGCSIFLVSSIAAIDLIVRKLFFGTLLIGWASLIVSIWLLGGLTIFCLGVIGIYLAKIFMEVKQRPYTIIRNVYEYRHDPVVSDGGSARDQETASPM